MFLPGGEEIDATVALLSELTADSSQRTQLVFLPLYGSLPSSAQLLALRPVPVGVRKVILATNIAETSLTIDGVGAVVDCGLVRLNLFDPHTGIDRLITTEVPTSLFLIFYIHSHSCRCPKPQHVSALVGRDVHNLGCV